jgi:hypothetical protein
MAHHLHEQADLGISTLSQRKAGGTAKLVGLGNWALRLLETAFI